MSKVTVRERYSDEFKVIDYLGKSYLLEVSQYKNRFPQLEDLKDKELISVPTKFKINLFKAGNNFYLITQKYVTEIIGTKQVWVITRDSESWKRAFGGIMTYSWYIIAVQEKDNSISIYRIYSSYPNHGINFVKNISQAYLPPADMYDANEMPLGIKAENHKIETFWSLINNWNTAQNSAFYIDFDDRDKDIEFHKNDLIGVIINPNFVLTRNGCLNMTIPAIVPFGVEEKEVTDEISKCKYINVPLEKGLCLAVPQSAESMLCQDNVRNNTWKIIGNDDLVCGFIWDTKTMTKLYPIQDEKPNSKLYLYNNGLPHIVVVEYNGVNKYYVYYWDKESMKFVISYQKPSIHLNGEDKFIIVKEENGNDLILYLTYYNKIIKEEHGYTVEHCILVNDKNEKEILPAYFSTNPYYYSRFPLQIFVLKDDYSQGVMIYNKYSKEPLLPVLLPSNEDLFLYMLQYGYVCLCYHTQENKKDTSYYNWRENRTYHGEGELWNASVIKAKSITEI